MFEVKISRSIDKNKICFTESGEYEFIGRSNENNGVQGHIHALHYEPNPADTFSLSQIGKSVCLFRQQKWYASQNIFVLLPKILQLTKTHLFVSSSINKALQAYESAYIYPTLPTIKALLIQLPICDTNTIDFEFMESYIAELEAERVAALSAYLTVSGLDNFELSEDEENLIQEISHCEFKGFDITEIFDIKNTHNILSRDIVEGSGKVPYLCASSVNNSISSYISYHEDYKEKGNCIFIGGKTFVVTYQKDDFFSNDSHNLALYLKHGDINRFNQLFLIACIYKSLSHQYSWGDSVSNTKIKKDILFLPTTNGKPNYELMEKIIPIVQKLVIKDVVAYVNDKTQVRT